MLSPRIKCLLNFVCFFQAGEKGEINPTVRVFIQSLEDTTKSRVELYPPAELLTV